MEELEGYTTTVVVGLNGRIVIPHKLRVLLEIQEGDALRVIYKGKNENIELELLNR